jgi:hypothetical protein
MNDAELLAAFHVRRRHYDTYLEANDIHLHTCPGCGFPSLTVRSEFSICIVCFWEDDGQDDNADSMLSNLFEGVKISGPNGSLTLAQNRINIGRILEANAELINGEIDLDTARVLKAIAFFQQRQEEIEDRIMGDESPYDHVWIELGEIRKDLQMALVVPKV